jgi:hypothetical protein
MDKLTKNKFLAAMGVLFAVAIVGFGILVYPTWNDAAKKTSSITNEVKRHNLELTDLPGDPNIKDWQVYTADLKKRYGDTLQRMLALDKNLGQWFDGLDDSSTYVVFMNKYDDERKALQNELNEKWVLLGSPTMMDNKPVESNLPGFNWVQSTDIKAGTTENERHAKEILQKRFNICRVVVNAVTANVEKGRGRQRRLLDVTFLEKFPYIAQALGSQPGDTKLTFTIPIDYKRYPGYFERAGSSSYVEQDLPHNGDVPIKAEAEAGKTSDAPAGPPAKGDDGPPLGKTLTFGFAVVMDYKDIPDLTRSLTDNSELNLSIVGLNVFVPEPNPAEVKETVTVKEGEDVEAIRTRFRKRTEDCPPPFVHVYVTCQVFDLDPAAVPSFLGKP